MRQATVVAALLILSLGSLVPAAMALAGSGRARGCCGCVRSGGGAELTADHALAVASFGKLFTGTIISGDTDSFSFKIVNEELLEAAAAWSIVYQQRHAGRRR